MATLGAARSIFRSVFARSAASRTAASGAKSAGSPFRAPVNNLSQRIFRRPAELSAWVPYGLSFATDKSSLREVFVPHGDVFKAKIIVDGETGRSKGSGFVSCPSVEEASAAVQALDGKDLHGRFIKVAYAATDKRGTTLGPRFSSGRGTQGYGLNSGQFRSQHTSTVGESYSGNSGGDSFNNGRLYISGARLVNDKQVKIALTKIDGIGPKKATQLCYRLGISDNIKIKDLTKYQIDQIEQMIG